MEERPAGYTFGTSAVARSPVTMTELRQLEQAVAWSEDDARLLRRLGERIGDQAEALVDGWRAVIGAQPHLAQWFVGPDGAPDERYKAAIKQRFVRWVLDTCRRPHDQAWLDYQNEIGLRHTPERKNRTDGAHTPPLVPLRFVVAFTAVVTTTLSRFLGDDAECEPMAQAWSKAVLLQVALWSRPYVKEGWW